MKKINLALIFGGKSGEHEVSIVSAKNIYQEINKDKYEVVLLAISKDGQWYLIENHQKFLHIEDYRAEDYSKFGKLVTIDVNTGNIIFVDNAELGKNIDIYFPVLHGPNGEDGKIQGLFEMASCAYVGCGLLSSAVCMDKDITKRLLKLNNIPVVDSAVINKGDKLDFSFFEKKFGLPIFVKAARMGSSVGVGKVKSKADWKNKIKESFKYDRKILIEKFIDCREIECSVLGNDKLKASILGEIKVNAEFYSYEAKYLDDNGAELIIPANVPDKLAAKIKEIALKTYKTLGCRGLARVDFFLDKENNFYVNEVNTMPGFTSISMYPKLWEATGIAQADLIEQLIQLGFTKFKDR